MAAPRPVSRRGASASGTRVSIPIYRGWSEVVTKRVSAQLPGYGQDHVAVCTKRSTQGRHMRSHASRRDRVGSLEGSEEGLGTGTLSILPYPPGVTLAISLPWPPRSRPGTPFGFASRP